MKTALITGASSGIGEELARCHAKKGGDLVVVARRKERLESLKHELENEYNVRVDVIVADLLDPFAAQDVYDEILKRKIRVDYLINNAGFGDNELFKKADNRTIQMMIKLNIMALTDFCHIFVHDLLDRGAEGKIMNVASTAAFQAVPYFAVYSATKAYVLSLSEALSLELQRDQITVTALCPGPTKTEFAANSNMNQDLANHRLLPTAKEVAEYGYKRMLKGQTVAVHGALNQIGANSGKLFPRKFVSQMAGRVMKMAGGH